MLILALNNRIGNIHIFLYHRESLSMFLNNLFKALFIQALLIKYLRYIRLNIIPNKPNLLPYLPHLPNKPFNLPLQLLKVILQRPDRLFFLHLQYFFQLRIIRNNLFHTGVEVLIHLLGEEGGFC